MTQPQRHIERPSDLSLLPEAMTALGENAVTSAALRRLQEEMQTAQFKTKLLNGIQERPNLKERYPDIDSALRALRAEMEAVRATLQMKGGYLEKLKDIEVRLARSDQRLVRIDKKVNPNIVSRIWNKWYVKYPVIIGGTAFLLWKLAEWMMGIMGEGEFAMGFPGLKWLQDYAQSMSKMDANPLAKVDVKKAAENTTPKQMFDKNSF